MQNSGTMANQMQAAMDDELEPQIESLGPRAIWGLCRGMQGCA